MEQVVEWQNRTLDAVYPIVYLDCIVLKVRQDSRVINKSVFLALGINIEGQKELLGMWLAEKEGAKFWFNVLTELKNRGLNDILIACVDDLKDYMFFGNDHGGERGTQLYTCRLNGIDPEAYLRYILSVLPEWPSNRVDELLPWNCSTYQ